jgi:hypothetical protein
MKAIDPLCLSLHGAHLVLKSDHAGFLGYARGHLEMLLSQAQETPDIQVHLHWDEQLATPDASSGQVHWLGRRLLLGNDGILQTEIPMLPGLQLKTSLDGTALLLQAAFRSPPQWMKLFPGLRHQVHQDRIYATLIYYLIYFPLLSYFERTRHWYPLHASAVNWPTGSVVLAGLGGVGKSTLTLALLSHPQAQLLSENLILYDSQRVYAFPEPIHLDDTSYQLLSNLPQRLSTTGRTYSHGRQSYQVYPSAQTLSGIPCLFCTLRQGRALALEPLPATEALEIVLSSDLLAKELNEYAQQAAALNLLSPRLGSHQERITALQQLLAGLPCYQLTIRPGEDLKRAINLVQEEIR